MLSPNARAGKGRIFSTAVRPKIGKKVTLDENFNSGPPITGRTLCVSKKLLYTICGVGHPHEMVFIEPSYIFLDEMVGDQDDCLAFEL